MNKQDVLYLRAEIVELNRLLAETPEDCPIDRLSLESRKSKLESILASLPVDPSEEVRATLTFRGKPVVGSRGVYASFGAHAVNDFVEAVAAIGASRDGALRKFLGTLEKHEATCAFQFRDDVFRFQDIAQVRQSANRLAKDNIHESETSLHGTFLGVLPQRRTFEFNADETQDTLTGRVGTSITDAATINQTIAQRVRARFSTRRVGQGRPTYTLIAYETIKNETP
ncbi:MAG: hypothetical protein ACPGUV_15170 [Polyangiales bacterium]